MIRTRARLVVLQVLVVSLLVLLSVRLWQVQVVRGAEFVAAATETRTRDVVVPAVRGQILDSAGRPLVRNRTRLVVSVDRTSLNRMEGNGRSVLQKLASVLNRRPADLRMRIRACGPGVTRPCWPGSPYQPIPIDDDVTTREALQILERQEEFPGVTAEVQAVREYPGSTAAAQALGYLQPITQEELERRAGASRSSGSTCPRRPSRPGCSKALPRKLPRRWSARCATRRCWSRPASRASWAPRSSPPSRIGSRCYRKRTSCRN